MGLTSSKGFRKEEQQQREIDYIIECLKHHRDNVYSIANCVNTQQAQVELLSVNMRNTLHIVDVLKDNSQRDDDSENETNKLQQLVSSKTVSDITERLLYSIQESLQFQSSSLQTSFTALNSCIHRALDSFRPVNEQSSGSSVDKVESRKWLIYRNFPETPINDINDELKYEKGKNTKLKEYIEKKKDEMDEKNCEIRKLSKETEDLLQEKKKHLTEKKELERKIVDLEEHIKQLSSREMSMTENIMSLKNENESLEKQKKDQESRIQVQLFYQSRGDIMSKEADELKSLLADCTGMGRNKIQFIDCLNEKDVNHDIPLFLMCTNASRICTDVGSTLQKLKGYVSTNVSVLIFHHKDAQALPRQGSDRVLTGPDFQMLGGIFDLAFLSEKGIYACDMNETAATGIVKFLREKH